jgi:hypothetical protein
MARRRVGYLQQQVCAIGTPTSVEQHMRLPCTTRSTKAGGSDDCTHQDCDVHICLAGKANVALASTRHPLRRLSICCMHL